MLQEMVITNVILTFWKNKKKLKKTKEKMLQIFLGQNIFNYFRGREEETKVRVTPICHGGGGNLPAPINIANFGVFALETSFFITWLLF